MRITDIARRSPVLAGWAALVAALAVLGLDPGGLATAGRNAAFDLYQRIAPRPYQDAPVVVVDIDEDTLARVGQWPWSRLRVARLVDRLAEAGAAAIAFDVLFAEPDRTSPQALLALWSETGPLTDETRRALTSGLPDPDRALADAFARAGNVVAAFGPKYDGDAGRAPALKASFATAGDDPLAFLPDLRAAVTELEPLEASAAGNGSIAFVADRDLTIRRLPMLAAYGGKLYPSLVLEALRVASGARTVVVKASGASGEAAFGQHTGIVSLRVGPLTVPLDAEGCLRLHYTGPAPARTVPAWQVLAPDFDRSRVEGKIVFVGASAAGLRDIRPSPLDPVMPGVMAHAQAAEQILGGAFLSRPDWAPGLEWLVAAVAGLLLAVAVARLGPWGSVAALAIAVAAVAGGSWYAWSARHMLLDPFLPGATVFAVFGVGIVVGYLRTEGEKRRIRGAFDRYLSPHLVAELARHPERLRLGGETREMTFLFCDVRGFTRISEAMKDDPQALTRLVNRFLTPLTDEILARGGTIDKYMGDCIMAFWNAPLDQADHADRACGAALAMMGALDRLNDELAAEAAAQGRPFERLAVGIGLNSGPCVVGNMGSNQRFDYSVLGDAVNLASRLEGQSKTYGVNVVIGERTRALAPAWAALELDLIAVKGKAEAVRIFALLGPPTRAADPAFAAVVETQRAFLEAYRSGDVDAASSKLDACRRAAPDLEALHALYAARLSDLRAHPAPAGWDGVFVARTK
jgi:adenylate cyclase